MNGIESNPSGAFWLIFTSSKIQKSAAFPRAALLALFLFGMTAPHAHAGVFSFASKITEIAEGMKNGGVVFYEKRSLRALNSQNMALLEPAINRNPAPFRGGGEITVVDGTALLADASPSSEKEKDGIETAINDQIAIYVVREGDTLSEIAAMFRVSINTIRWANDIPKNGTIAEGDKLVILPVSGIRYTAKQGDTIARLAEKYQADADEIREFNGIAGNDLVVGTSLLLPNGAIPAPTPTVPLSQKNTSPSSRIAHGSLPASPDGYFIRPISGKRTQGIHGYNGIDLGAPIGTSVVAAAGGTVVVSKASGWNGGYGQYIVIRHANGTQTLYAHLSSNLVSSGATVAQGESIALSGNSGRSTGPHLHFEVRGAKNPF